MDTQQEDDVYSNSTQQLRNVLVACKLDVSDRQLLNYGCALTCACDATLHLLHVTKQNATNEQIDDSARKGRAELERALPPELVMDTDVRWEVRSGNPAQEFIQYAHENDVDMIIVGSQKHATWFAVCPSLGCRSDEATVVPGRDCSVGKIKRESFAEKDCGSATRRVWRRRIGRAVFNRIPHAVISAGSFSTCDSKC